MTSGTSQETQSADGASGGTQDVLTPHLSHLGLSALWHVQPAPGTGQLLKEDHTQRVTGVCSKAVRFQCPGGVGQGQTVSAVLLQFPLGG